MKKHGFLFILFLFFFSTLNGQINFGIKAGGNYSVVLVSDNSSLRFLNEAEPVLKYHSGFFAEYYIHPRLGIRSEFQYSRQGAKIPDSNQQFIEAVDFEYLTLPVIIKLGWENQFYGEFGASVSRKINNSGLIFSDPAFNEVIGSADSDTAVLFGFNVKIFRKLWLNLRYSLGQKSIVDISGLIFAQPESVNAQNRLFQLSLELNLNHKND